MSLSNIQKKKLVSFRGWVKKQKRRQRTPSYPSFSYGLDGRINKIMLCYTYNTVIGYDKKKDEPIVRRKKKKKYLDTVIDNYEDISIKSHYMFVKKEVENYERLNDEESQNMFSWVNDYYEKPIRFGKEVSHRSRLQDLRTLQNYMDWLKMNSPRHLDIYEHLDDGRKVFEDYISHMRTVQSARGMKFSQNSISSMYRRIKSFFNWISDKDQRFPFNMLKLKGISQERNKQKLPPAVSRDDMRTILKWMDENKDDKYNKWFIPILRMLLISGCRISEVIEMRIEDINLKTREWSFFGKTKRRTLLLDSETLWSEIMDSILDKNGKVRTDTEWVFPSSFYRKPHPKTQAGGGLKENLKVHFSKSGVYHRFKQLVSELNLDEKLSPHSCRRGFITILLEEGRSIQEISTLVGHSGYDMVYRYSRQKVSNNRNTINVGKILSEE